MNRMSLSFCVAALPVLLSARVGDVHEVFLDPPDEARPHIWYHWTGEYVTEEGIVRDFKAMGNLGFGTAYVFCPSGGGVPRSNAVPMSENWLKLMTLSIKEAKKNGMTLGFHNCPGWTSSGGPWITPENSMKYVVFSDSDVEAAADGSLAASLPQPPTRCGYYRDIAAYAFPSSKQVQPLDAEIPHRFKVKETGTSESVEWRYPRPICPKSFLFRTGKARWSVINCKVELSARVGDEWRPLTSANYNYHNRTFDDRVMRIAKPVLSDSFRITVTSTKPEPWIHPADVEFTAAQFSELSYVPNIIQKNSAAEFYGYRAPADPDEKGIDPRCVKDVSRFLKPDGSISAPAGAFAPGNWRVVRIGCTSTGEAPHPTPIGGLECDKLDRKGLEAHWQAMPEKVLALPGAKETVKYVVIDSYEVGGQNWTSILPDEFRRRRGHDIGVNLLAVCGYTVGTAAKTADFLWEWQQVIGELFAENYYDYFTELCHQAGVKSVIESYGGPFDAVRCGASADVPSGELWLGRNTHRSFPFMQGIARKYGKRIVAAESFTTETKEGRWQATPREFRFAGDLAWINGINRLVVHSYLHQPYGDVKPGLSLGRHGSQFNRNTTWWRDGRGWTDYVRRGQALLQYGRLGLETDGVPEPVGPKVIRTLRREGKNGERIYFVLNDADEPFFGSVSFAAPEGSWPELFDAKDGSVAAAPRRAGKDGMTDVQLDLRAHGSVFVVFSRTADRESAPKPSSKSQEKVLTDLSSDWTIVSFDGLAAPQVPLRLDRLVSWSESADLRLRHYSGYATYEKKVDVPQACVLDLGDVRDVANVFCDGKKIACLWDAPYRTKIPAGCHVLRIEVVNTWPNRMIGDAIVRKAGVKEARDPKTKLPQWVLDGKGESGVGVYTWSNWLDGWKAEDKPIPAGLIGPVRLVSVVKADELFPDGARVVFFGDSITHHGYWSGAIADWFLTHYPDRHYEFVNAGVAGDSAGNARVRISEDVAPANPTLVISMFGMNDIGRHSYKGDKSTPDMIKQQQTSLAAYRKNMTALGDELRRQCPAAKLQWLTPSPYDDRVLPAAQSHLGANRGLAECAKFVREEAARTGDDCVEVHAPMTEFVDGLWKSNTGFTLCGKDGIHPREEGGLFMAWCYLKAAGIDPTVSDIAVNARSLKVEKSVNATVFGLAAKSGGVRIVVKEHSLPMPIRKGAERLAKRIPFDELCRETLTVKGLTAGRWELKIDGQSVTTATSADFARGLDLSLLDTPQRRQAQEIAALNVKIRDLTDLRQCFRALRHFKLRRELKEKIDDKEAVSAFCEAHRNDPKFKGDYFWQFAESYVREWPVFERKDAEIRALNDKMNALRKVAEREYAIVPASAKGK